MARKSALALGGKFLVRPGTKDTYIRTDKKERKEGAAPERRLG